jgi:hypothetical protein
MTDERRFDERRKFGYYMRVVDTNTQEPVGYLADISPRGFKLDSKQALMINKDYTLRLDLTPEISDKPYIVFVARAKWSHPDSFEPNAHNDGFQIVSISARDEEIFQRIVAKYGSPENKW